MRNTLRKVLTPPVFPEDDAKTRSALYLNLILLVCIPAFIAFLLLRVLQGNRLFESSNLILFGCIVVLSITVGVLRSGFVRLAAYIYIATIWIASTLLALNGEGIRGSSFANYFVVMLLADLLLGVWPAVGVAILSVTSGFGLAYAETAGMIVHTPGQGFGMAIEYTFPFLLSALLIVLRITSIQNALAVAKANAKELEARNIDLAGLRDALELRMQERTSSLEKRDAQIRAIASMAKAIVFVQDLDALLPNIARQVSEQFGYYHTGIFLLDEARQYAVLKAANSEGGRRMLNRGHRLLLDAKSIVGFVSSRGEPRIVLDVSADSVYFNNPDLPETRSEMALPLLVSGRVIGALDVQSTERNAFTEENIFVLAALADQIAIAIENSRLFGEAQKALADAQETYQKYVSQSWNNFVQQARHTGFSFDGKQVIPLDNQSRREQIKAAIQTGSLSLDKASQTIAIPIKLRGQTIGVLDVRSKKGERRWTQDEITLLEAAAERAALALENARLVESAQRRAARERAIGDISAKIGAVSSFEYILQTAVEELGRKIGGATEVTMEISSEDGQVYQR